MNSRQIGSSPGYTFAYYELDSSLDKFLWSIDRLSELGFTNYGLEILEPEHVSIYRDNRGIDQLLSRSHLRGMNLSSFTIWPCSTNLVSADPQRRDLGVRQFVEGAEIARDLGIRLVAFGSDWPPEWVRSYRGEYQHGPAGDFFVPSQEDWQQVWSGHREALAKCLEVAAQHGLRLGLEPRANSLVSTADAFLRLWDSLACEQFGCVLDVMHCAYHRENVPAAIKKLGARLAGLQLCGTDGVTMNHLPLDPQNEQLHRIVAELSEIGYQGVVDVEVYGVPANAIDESYRQAREILTRL